MLEIDWDSEDDRGRRRRKASTIHGWLCMWRGTLVGNERVRQRGRREMKEARAARAYYRQRAQESAGGGSGPFSLFRLGSFCSVTRKANATAPSPPAPAPRQPQRHRSHSSQHHHHHHQSGNSPQKRPPPVKRKSSSRHAAPARRQEPMRQSSSHSAKSRPSTSRRPSSSRR